MKILKLLLSITLIFSVYINYSVYDSWVLFENLLVDFNSNKYSELNYKKLLKQNTKYSTLSPTAVCINDLLARYEFLFGEKLKSLEIIDNHKCANPHWGIRELIKSEIFFSLKIEDSATFYSKKAIEILPNNILHYESYLKTLKRNKNFQEMIQIFKDDKIKKTANHYMLFLYNYDNDLDENKNFIDSVALLSKRLFPLNDKINLYADNQLIDQNSLKESINFSKNANALFKQKKYADAIEYYTKAIELNPYLNWVYENLAMSYLILEKYENAVNSINQVINLNLSQTGKAEYIKAVALAGMDLDLNKEEICQLINASIGRKYEKAVGLKYKYCFQ